ncbi:MAG: secretin N-terminal domain-containing protein [Candidatus Omnitrophota bacterium]|jgi:type IV pilus assembly protein PilQ
MAHPKTTLLLAVMACLLLGQSLVLCVGAAYSDEEAKSAPAEAQESKEAVPAEAPQAAVPAVAAQSTTTSAAAAAEGEAPVEAEEEEAAVNVEPGNVTVNFKGADIKTVLAYISEVSGVDIVPAPDVKGVVDLKLTNKPWKTALDIIVRNYGFAYEREGDIIRVVTVDKLKQEELVSQPFSLNYSKSKDVVESVKNIVSDRGKVMYDERTNTVIVTDIPTNIYKIGQVIARLDKMTDQVLIEARVIETVLSNDERLGIDWNVKIAVAGAKRPITAPFDYFNRAQEENSWLNRYLPLVQSGQKQVIGYTAAGDPIFQDPASYPTGKAGQGDGSKGFPYVDYKTDLFKDTFTFGTLDFSQFSAVLEMLKQRADTEIVSNPRIATLNNNEAMINVGQTLNLPKYERNSTTGKMEITGYEGKNLGVLLKVTPHVNDNGEIVIDLAPEITDLLRYDTLDAASGIVAPVFSARFAKTQVMVKDGDTIFIGGLIKENDVKVTKKLPILGDIFGDVPYVGLLFSKKETTKQKTELIFFVTVNLMHHGKAVRGAPSPKKAAQPRYTETQQGGRKSKKLSRKEL